MGRHHLRSLVLLSAACGFLTSGCDRLPEPSRPSSSVSQGTVDATDADGRPFQPTLISTQRLPNVVHVHEQVYSGGLPEGDAAFAELKALGIRTIISVDGARPDLDLAERFGMTYVHLPHGYDGISTARVQELAKAVLELPGPIYIHCHHGKHRSPAAASSACITAGLISADQGSAVLKIAGTNPHYRGLFQTVSRAKTLPVAELQRLSVNFVPIAKIPPLAEAMVHLEHTFDQLKERLQRSPLVMEPTAIQELAHEALLLREHFTEMLRLQEVAEYPAVFRESLAQSEAAAIDLESRLNQLQTAPSASPPTAEAESLRASFQVIQTQCKACHEQFRDLPPASSQTP